MNKKWVPREVDELQTNDEFMERLNRWTKNPESDTELEAWYKYGYPESLPFEVKKPEQWEVDCEIYFPIYEDARQFQLDGQEEEALKLYLNIHERFTPRGTIYYDDPFRILEKRGHFDKAIELCEKAITAISNKLFNADIEPYQRVVIRLKNKIEQCVGYPSYEAFVFEKIVEIVADYPDINVGSLQSKLDGYDVFGSRSYIDKAVEFNLIKREKHGRSLIHNLP